jgi:peptide/nickel transport system substrate-binding protein
MTRILALAVLLLLAAAAATPAQAPRRGGVLRVAEQSDPVGFDTLGKKKAPVFTQLALGYTHSRLFKYDAAGDVVPDLAASWTQPTPTTYVVTLRKGVRFHPKPPVNGRELTSDDVKFTFERMARSPEARLFPTLTSVTTPDRYTVRFELSAPFSAFIANLAATTMYIYAREAGKPTPDGAGDYTAASTVVGTGPFMLEEYREKQRMVLKRHPDYFQPEQPYLDGVEVYTIADAAAQLAALRTGKLDLMPAGRGEGLPHFLVPEARAIPGATVLPHRLFQSSENLIGRLDQKPWNDVRVRRAVSMIIDRPGFARALYPEGAEPISGPIPVTSRHFRPLERLGEAAAWYRHDPAAARRLLADAGYPNGLPIRLTTTSGYGPTYLSRTELLKSMLSRLGIEAAIVVQEYPVWISSTYKGSFDGLVHIPAWTLGDEDEWLASYTPGDTRNQMHLDDPRLTELIQMARGAPTEAARAPLISQFLTVFHDQLYRVFLPAPAHVTVVARRVRGYVPPLRGYSYPTALANVWLE